MSALSLGESRCLQRVTSQSPWAWLALGFESTVTTGIVSALGGSLPGFGERLIEDLIQAPP